VRTGQSTQNIKNHFKNEQREITTMLNYETILKSLNEPQAAGNETKLCAKRTSESGGC